MIPELIAKIRKKKFFLNIITLVSGSALAQVLGVFLSPIISRLYSPESFGIVGIIVATASIVATIGSLKLEMAIVMERNDRFANEIQILCFKLLGFISLLFILFLFFSTAVFDWFGNNGVSTSYIWFAIPIALGMSINNILRGRLNRERKYKLIASSSVAEKLSNNLLQIGLGFLGAKALGLIAGNVLGIFIALLLIILTEKKLFLRFSNSKKLQSLLIQKYRKFPQYSAPQNVLNSISQQLPIYLLGFYYGAEAVGYYWFAMRLIQIPSALISNSIRQVFFKEAVVLKNNLPRLKQLYLRLTTNLAGLIVLPAIIFFFTAPWLFSFVFGEQWIMAGHYAKWMFLWISLNFINPPSVILFNVFNNQNILFKYEILLIILRTLSLLVGGMYDLGAINTIIIYSLVGASFNCFLIGSSYFFNIQKKIK